MIEGREKAVESDYPSTLELLLGIGNIYKIVEMQTSLRIYKCI